MAFVAVLQTQNEDIRVLSGQLLDVQFDCFTDDAFTIPFDLSDYALTVVLEPPNLTNVSTAITLTPGSGLTVVGPEGLVQMMQDTTGWPVGRGR